MDVKVARLRVFSSEVTRVAREVGTDGQLGGQAVVHGVEGTWKELVRPSFLTCHPIRPLPPLLINSDHPLPSIPLDPLQQTESVNQMAQNLTLQVREIASVTKAVADGDLSKTVDIGASGEIRELKMTVNSMCVLFPSLLSPSLPSFLLPLLIDALWLAGSLNCVGSLLKSLGSRSRSERKDSSEDRRTSRACGASGRALSIR